MTISSWLNFGHLAPPGGGLRSGGAKVFWLRLYSQRAVFASDFSLSALFISFVVVWRTAITAAHVTSHIRTDIKTLRFSRKISLLITSSHTRKNWPISAQLKIFLLSVFIYHNRAFQTLTFYTLHSVIRRCSITLYWEFLKIIKTLMSVEQYRNRR